EDVGRHNAVDKALGQRLIAGVTPPLGQLLVLSGRVGFELVQKAAVARIPVVVAVSAPTSLALEAATQLGVTVVGFARGDGFTAYTHPERIVDHA
ncbi:MAG: formate dehydrogenase accessory sulfurtransferase FdhD, partial [Deltaproteobacteria bacterium]|nr:formate dehydrogenase accessory sulfurtransferase FdhD [Deltaproteobacteria bacterium]